jgi:hypothetical protein
MIDDDDGDGDDVHIIRRYRHGFVSLSGSHTKLLLMLWAAVSSSIGCVDAKELVATTEWQRVGPDDTLPAGLEIRMDLSGTGGKWARLLPPSVPEDHGVLLEPSTPRCGPDCKERQRQRRAGLRGTTGIRQNGEAAPYESFTPSYSSTVELLFLGGAVVLSVGVARRMRERWRDRLHEL